MLLASGFSPLFGRLNQLPWSYFYQFMSDLPEYPALTGTSEITLRLLGTGASSTYTNAAVSTPVKGWLVMLMVPGLPKDTSATITTRAAEAKVQLLLQVSRSSTNSAHSVDIEDPNVNDYDNYCDSTGSDNELLFRQ